MKIRIEMTKGETRRINHFANKYDQDNDGITTRKADAKFGSCDSVVNEDGSSTMDISLNEIFMNDVFDAIEDFSDVIIGCFKHLKFLYKEIKNRFKRWEDNLIDSAIRHIKDSKEPDGIYAIKKDFRWKTINKDTRKRVESVSYMTVCDTESAKKLADDGYKFYIITGNTERWITLDEVIATFNIYNKSIFLKEEYL